MLRHGGSQPRKEESASHPARRGKNAEAFLNDSCFAASDKRYNESYNAHEGQRYAAV